MGERAGWLSGVIKGALFRSWRGSGIWPDCKAWIDNRIEEHKKEKKIARPHISSLAWYECAQKNPIKSQDIMDMVGLAYKEWMALDPKLREYTAERKIPSPKVSKSNRSKGTRKQGSLIGTGSIKMGTPHDPTDPKNLSLEFSARDVAWVYNNLSNPLASQESAPSNGGWGLLQYARSYPADFYKSILPAAMKRAIGDTDDADKLPNEEDMAAFEKALDEINAVVTQQANPAS